jgi:hypothetical protein
VREVNNIFKKMLIIFFDIKGTGHKAFITAGLTVNWADFALYYGDKRPGCCITTTHCLTFPFHHGIFFTKNNMTALPHPSNLPAFGPCNFSASPTDDRNERPPFSCN